MGKSIDAFIKFPESEPLTFKKDGHPFGKLICGERENPTNIHGGSFSDSILSASLRSSVCKFKEDQQASLCKVMIQTASYRGFYQFTKTDFFVKSPGTVLSSQGSD
jgi:hypothetical protein